MITVGQTLFLPKMLVSRMVFDRKTQNLSFQVVRSRFRIRTARVLPSRRRRSKQTRRWEKSRSSKALWMFGNFSFVYFFIDFFSRKEFPTLTKAGLGARNRILDITGLTCRIWSWAGWAHLRWLRLASQYVWTKCKLVTSTLATVLVWKNLKYLKLNLAFCH